MKTPKYDAQQLRAAVSTSFSIRQVCKTLGIAPHGGSYATLHKYLKLWEIDTSHFKGQGWLKGLQREAEQRPLHKVLVKGKREQSYWLKNRLFREKVKERVCEHCNLAEWRGLPIPLELHHRDGDTANNELMNLEIVCPNCHAQTENYRGKNKGFMTKEPEKRTDYPPTPKREPKPGRVEPRRPRPTPVKQ